MEQTTPPSRLTRLSLAIRQLLPSLLTMAALALAMLGQRRFSVTDPSSLRAGLMLFLAGALCMILARLSLRPAAEAEGEPPPTTGAQNAQRMHLASWRWLLSFVGALLGAAVVAALWVIPAPPPEGFSYTSYLWSWLLASLLAAAPWFVPQRETAWKTRAIASLRTYRWEIVGLALVTLLAGGLRLADLSNAPYAISGDEGGLGDEVYRVFSGELRNPFALTIYGPYPSMVPFILAIPLRLFGATIGALRLPGALFGTLAIPALWALARPIVGRRAALVAVLFLATLPMHLHYSRVAINVIWDTFFFTGALALFWRGMQRHVQAMWTFALAGLVGGFGQYSYTGSRLLPLLLFSFLLYLAVFDLEWLKSKARGILLMALVFAVDAGPLYLYAAQHPDDFNARINAVGVFQSGWLENETAIRGEDKFPILWDQFRRALFGFAFFPDRTSSWGADTPLAPTLLSLGLFLGLIISLRHWRDPAMVLLHGWFWSIILSAGTLTVNPPTSNRLVGLTPVLCLFAALGWQGMAKALAQACPPPRQRMAQTVVLALFAGLASLEGVRAHERHLENNLFGGPEVLEATMIGHRLAELPPDSTLVMLMAPRLYSDISPLKFLTPKYTRVDIVEPLTEPPADPSDGSGDLLFIVLPERVNEAGYIQQAFPDSTMREVRRENQDQTLLYYEILVER
ncbi:MAG: glycosyltransferase family 39 protein [Ardenticatenales bacterium]|nr:glycosyltransferase family 39 protein [Ardenticatenales bacterium]